MTRAAADLVERTQALRTRLAWITGLRLLFLMLLLAAMVVFYLRGAIFQYAESQRVVLATLGTGFALAAAYAFVLRSGKNLTALSYAQLTLDQLTWTAIVYITGGATSGATTLYGLTCVLGALLIGIRGALYAACVGLFAYAALSVGFALRVLTPPVDQPGMLYLVSLDRLAFPFLVNGLGIVVVAMLSGYLAERLRSTRGALDVANLRAEEAERLAMLGKLAAGLAHEIRNPLSSISGSIEMLKESPELSAEDKQLCDIVQREAERLNQLVSDMMDIAKPRPPAPIDTDVAKLAREVVALAARSERSGSGDVRVEYTGVTGSAIAYCDGGQIRQVVWNLVRNAVQASAAGTVVRVAVEKKEDVVVLTVTDVGPGITELARARIFDAFYTTRTKGAGIGLAVVKRIVDDHASLGAKIEVTSPDEGGACFEVTLRKGATAEVETASELVVDNAVP